MKKSYIIIIAICLMRLGITAQPVITHNGNAPQIGDIYNQSGANGNFDPGPNGAGQNWDFSDITPTLSLSGTTVTPASTPFSGDFPESNIAFHYTGSGDYESYSYAEINTTEMLNDGIGMEPGTANEFIIHYTDAVKIMQYPFAFNDSYTDTYFTSYSVYGDMLTHEYGNIIVTADAWGSVSTPAATYTSTLRVKSERTYTDSVWVSGNFLSASTHTQTDYEWFTATSHTPVLSISVREDGTSAIYSTSAVGIEEENLLQSQISLYPNPATDRINIKLPKGSTGHTDISIYDLTGKQIMYLKKIGNNLFSANISSLVPGEYVIRMNSSTKNFITKRFIKASLK